MTSPSANAHIEQAGANLAHAEWLLTTRSHDLTARQWAVTAIFYSALHAMTAHLLAQGVSVKSHTERVKAIMNPVHGVPLPVMQAYRRLEEKSRGARYELRVFATGDVRDLLDQELAIISAFAGM